MAGRRVECRKCGTLIRVPGDLTPAEWRRRLDDLGDTWSLTRPVRKPSRWPWIAGAVGAAVLVVVVIVAVLTSGGGVQRPLASEPRAAPASPAAETPSATQRAAPSPRCIAVAVRPQARARSTSQAPLTEAPAFRAPAPDRPVGTAGAPAAMGPAQEPLGAQLDAVLNGWLEVLVPTGPTGVAALAYGRKVEIARDGRIFAGTVYRQSSVLRVNGKLRVGELYVLTTAPWQVSDDTYVPAQTCIISRSGKYELVSVAALKAAQAEKEEYLKAALAQADAAAARQDWSRARQVLADAQAKYPGEDALRRREAALRAQASAPIITVVNTAVVPLSVRLRQGGAVAVAQVIGAGESRRLSVPRGAYAADWSSDVTHTGENVTVEHSQTWTFTLAAQASVPGMEPELRWTRSVR